MGAKGSGRPGGNPDLKGTGRIKGSKNKATLMREDILRGILDAAQEIGGVKTIFLEMWSSRKTRPMIAQILAGLVPKKDELTLSGTLNTRNGDGLSDAQLEKIAAGDSE